MEGNYTVYNSEGEPCGTLSIKREGLFTVFHAQIERVMPVSRLYSLSDGIWRNIGVPAPKNGGMELTRRFSRAELVSSGITTPERVIIMPLSQSPPARDNPVKPADVPESPEEQPANVWQTDGEPWKLVRDMELSDEIKNTDGVLVSNGRIAVPYNDGEEMPLVQFFRLGTPENINGNDYIVFSVKNGEIV